MKNIRIITVVLFLSFVVGSPAGRAATDEELANKYITTYSAIERDLRSASAHIRKHQAWLLHRVTELRKVGDESTAQTLEKEIKSMDRAARLIEPLVDASAESVRKSKLFKNLQEEVSSELK